MTVEGKLQSKIIKWLKGEGAYVIKNRAAPGVPVGIPDILFLFEGAWGAIEVKRSSRAPWQPGQEATFKRLSQWSPFVYKAYPENWPDIQKTLKTLFF